MHKLAAASRLHSRKSTLQTWTALTTNKTCDIFTLPHVWWAMSHDRRLIDTTRFCDQIIPYNYPPSCSLSTLFDIPSAPTTPADKHVTRWPSSFFFFHWHYSPLWGLVCWTMSFHFFLSATNSLHLLTPSTWRSLYTSSFHLFLGLPLLLVPSISWVKIFLGTLSSSILSGPHRYVHWELAN